MGTTGCNPEELFKAYKAPILRYIRGHKIVQQIRREMGDANEVASIAEDISQELWLRVLKHEGQLENTRRTKSWLYTIADNLVKDYQRTRFRKRTERLETLGSAGAENRAGEEDSPSFEPLDCRAQEWLLNLEEEEEVDFRLLRIDVPSGEVIKYRLAGWSLSEIAEMTDTPLSTVKARFYRAKAKLETETSPVVHLELAHMRCGSIETLRKRHMFFARR